jgi:hypothetical protein
MSRMIPVKVVALLLLILVWFPPLTGYGDLSNQKDLLVVKRANGHWLPNTVLPNGAPAYFYNGHWYSYCEAGLIRFDGHTNEVSVLPLPELTSQYPFISGMAMVNNILWVSMRSDDGIFLFDLDQQAFTGSIKMAKGTGFGEGANVNIIQDTFNKKIWMSSFGHLDVYDIESGQWENLDPIFSVLRIGKPSSVHTIFPDNDFIWINAPAHAHSRGGLIQFDLKTDKRILFRKELVGSESEPDRLDNMSLLSSPNYLWVYFSVDNGYNFYIAVYDKKNHIWKSYNRGAVIPAIDLLISELPHTKWVGENFLIDLSRLLSEKIGSDHPYRFQSEQLKVLKSALNSLSAAFRTCNIDHSYDNYGLHDHSIHNATIYKTTNTLGKSQLLHATNLNQTRFVRLIGTSEHYIVVETNEGLAIVDHHRNIIRYLSPLTKLSAEIVSIWWPKDKKNAIIREEGEEYLRTISLDLEGLKINTLKRLDKHKERQLQALPMNRVVLADKEITLQWDGLLIKPLKSDN